MSAAYLSMVLCRSLHDDLHLFIIMVLGPVDGKADVDHWAIFAILETGLGRHF